MRTPWRTACALVPLLGGCGGGNTASELVKAPEFNPAGQTKCSVGKSQAKPLIVEWPAADRGALEAQKAKGLVAVRYRGCEMEVLRQCTGPVAYGYTPVTPKEDHIRIKDEDELYAAIPVYAAKFEGKLRTAGELHVDMTIVGSFEADRSSLKQSELEGDCSKATHFISAITTGAFEFAAGGSAEVGAGVEVAGAEAGAKSSAEREILNRDGYKKACQEATSEDTTPPEGCGALLRVEVVALDEEERPATPDPDAPPPPVDDEPVALGPGVVKVHIDSDDPDQIIQLVRFGPAVATQVPVQQQGGGTVMTTAMIPSRELICTAPCDSWVDGRKGQQFVIAGDGIPESEPFRLHEREGDVTIQVDPGSGGGIAAGFSLTYLGLAGAAMGPLFIGLAYAMPDEEYDEEKMEYVETGPKGAFLYTGIAASVVAVVGLAIGIPVWITSGTDYEMAGADQSPFVPRVASNGDLQWTF
ncbi:MAG: hypothetical protein JRI23_15410 [Deltaproteobacteria bacterium]|jgi:hypothetical protein|nr:hypothetical protein [Deltaproteobacteria bacterium]MBW2533140.1 hypothetical protein [Deltaproteobacteria bacterium]